MTLFEIIILALIQGITEFLPVSSSGHLNLIGELTSWSDQGILIDIAVHMGTLIAVIAYFRREVWQMIVGFFLLLRWSTRVALKARTRFGQLTAAGLTMTIFFYIAINLMMVMGLAPVVGIPLPLFSYGGSSMLTIMTCIGIILAIETDSKTGTRRLH